MRKFSKFEAAYLEAAIWASLDWDNQVNGNPTPMDEYGLSIYDFDERTLETMLADCAKFQEQAGDLLADIDDEQAGHDFWLTRNRHGAGFWDGDYPEEVGDKLTEFAHSFPEINLYLFDDKIHA